MGDDIDIVLENVALDSVHVFMHQYTEGFDNAYVRETCVDADIFKPKKYFLDDNIANIRVASKVQKLKLAINALKKTKVVKAKS